MSEYSFQEVMREKTRMHRHYVDKYGFGDCGTCPLKYVVCNKSNCEWNEDDYKAVENIVMEWAKEHPVAVYPTWTEWLRSMGMVSTGTVTETRHTLNSINITNKKADILCGDADKPIPEELAVKIGLKPKKVKPDA